MVDQLARLPKTEAGDARLTQPREKDADKKNNLSSWFAAHWTDICRVLDELEFDSSSGDNDEEEWGKRRSNGDKLDKNTRT
jgi:hypothetical protein